MKYADRLPANESLERVIVGLLPHLVGRLEELFGRVDFMVTNLTFPRRAVAGFYNKKGTAARWIKEGQPTVKIARLSCHRFWSNGVRPWLSRFSYSLGDVWL